MIARRIRELPFNSVAVQHLYQVDPPMRLDRSWMFEDGEEDTESTTYNYVVASAAIVPFSGPETYLFGATPEGDIVNWSELSGSQRGTLDHEQVIRDAGYTIEETT